MCLLAGTFGANAQLLWKVCGKNLAKESYIFGTHHLAPVSMVDSVCGLREAIGRADAVAGEVEMGFMDDSEAIQSIAAFYVAPADSMLSSVLNPAQVDSLNMVLGKYSAGMLTAEAMNSMKPAAVGNQLALFVAMEAMGPDAARSLMGGEQLDGYIQSEATRLGKLVLAFETVEDQMQVLLGNPISEQAEELMHAVAEILDGTAMTQTRELTEAYLSQNLEAVAKVMFDSENMDEEERTRLLDNRNQAWISKLLEWMPKHSVLVAVGAGHLPGPGGLIERLKAAGFVVTPVE